MFMQTFALDVWSIRDAAAFVKRGFKGLRQGSEEVVSCQLSALTTDKDLSGCVADCAILRPCMEPCDPDAGSIPKRRLTLLCYDDNARPPETPGRAGAARG